MKKQTAREIAALFEKRLEDANLISDIFDYMSFNCSIRAYIDPMLLDQTIRGFYEKKSIDGLCAVIELIQQGKDAFEMGEEALLKNVKEYIIGHFADKITVEQIAYKFHVSYYYLCHLFKKMTNKSINRFKTEKMLEKAIRMLSETDDKVSDIASECGFDNFSYFSEVFVKYIGVSPSEFRERYKECVFLPFQEFDDMLLAMKMKPVRVLSEKREKDESEMPFVQVHNPGPDFGTFLHEAAIIEYEGTLYASWYNCIEKELIGYTPIVERRSLDGGKTWSEPQIIADDKSGKILYCPPVYGICDGKLYMILNQMVSADHMHSLDLYVLNKDTDKFEMLWSRPIPFKLNTNVVTLPNGKLILPGRIAELDGFPNTPAVMISDSGKIDGEWRVVKVAENGNLPNGSSLIHPETTIILCDDVIYLFNRNDTRRVPIVYVSKDYGETWSGAMAHDIPYVNSKIYTGTLSDGRFYLIANAEDFGRSRLTLYISEKGKLSFIKEKVLYDCKKRRCGIYQCHYPSAVEYNGKLHVIATASYSNDKLKGRGAILFSVDLDE